MCGPLVLGRRCNAPAIVTARAIRLIKTLKLNYVQSKNTVIQVLHLKVFGGRAQFSFNKLILYNIYL